MVTETEHFVAHVPFAARWPYEVNIVPRRQVPDLPALSEAELDDLAVIYLDVLGRFDRLFTTPAPYIAGWQQSPVRQGREAWHMSALDLHDPAQQQQTQVPGRVRVRRGRLDQRHPARGGRGAVAVRTPRAREMSLWCS